MAHPKEIKYKVQALRKEGKTYPEIMTQLNIELPKSTLSDWCKNVPMPNWYKQKIEDMNKKASLKHCVPHMHLFNYSAKNY
jgi:hypothetical protein